MPINRPYAKNTIYFNQLLYQTVFDVSISLLTLELFYPNYNRWKPISLRQTSTASCLGSSSRGWLFHWQSSFTSTRPWSLWSSSRRFSLTREWNTGPYSKLKTRMSEIMGSQRTVLSSVCLKIVKICTFVICKRYYNLNNFLGIL